MTNTTSQLPTYPDNELASLDVLGLIALMIADEDRVPRNVIDECARRGDAMVDALSVLLEEIDDWLEEVSSGVWWMRHHAIMILGLIPSEAAGMLMIEFMRRMSQEEDDNLQDWFAGRWPALFLNKPESVSEALRTFCEDRTLDWYIRVNAMEAYLSTQHAVGNDALEQALEWLAGFVADENEDWDLRLCTGSDLLDFPRSQYRPLLENLAAQQSGLGVHFSKSDLDKAYAAMLDEPGWERYGKDPWEFYSPKAITARQERWAKEDAEEEPREWDDLDEYEDDLYYDQLPYMRETPKIGRNDPCPCGSGKKYKKCCLEKNK